jgi:hypothetical protein
VIDANWWIIARTLMIYEFIRALARCTKKGNPAARLKPPVLSSRPFAEVKIIIRNKLLCKLLQRAGEGKEEDFPFAELIFCLQSLSYE